MFCTFIYFISVD